MKPVRYILCDPLTATVTEVHASTLDQMRAHLRCQWVEQAPYHPADSPLRLWFDEEGRINGAGRRDGAVIFGSYPAPIMGPLMLSGPIVKGRETDCPITLEAARLLCSFIHREAFTNGRR